MDRLNGQVIKNCSECKQEYNCKEVYGGYIQPKEIPEKCPLKKCDVIKGDDLKKFMFPSINIEKPDNIAKIIIVYKEGV